MLDLADRKTDPIPEPSLPTCALVFSQVSFSELGLSKNQSTCLIVGSFASQCSIIFILIWQCTDLVYCPMNGTIAATFKVCAWQHTEATLNCLHGHSNCFPCTPFRFTCDKVFEEWRESFAGNLLMMNVRMQIARKQTSVADSLFITTIAAALRVLFAQGTSYSVQFCLNQCSSNIIRFH